MGDGDRDGSVPYGWDVYIGVYMVTLCPIGNRFLLFHFIFFFSPNDSLRRRRRRRRRFVTNGVIMILLLLYYTLIYVNMDCVRARVVVVICVESSVWHEFTWLCHRHSAARCCYVCSVLSLFFRFFSFARSLALHFVSMPWHTPPLVRARCFSRSPFFGFHTQMSVSSSLNRLYCCWLLLPLLLLRLLLI